MGGLSASEARSVAKKVIRANPSKWRSKNFWISQDFVQDMRDFFKENPLKNEDSVLEFLMDASVSGPMFTKFKKDYATAAARVRIVIGNIVSALSKESEAQDMSNVERRHVAAAIIDESW